MSEKPEDIAEASIKNPMKGLLWVLLIAISTLASVVVYIYKEDNTNKEKSLKVCTETNRRLEDSCYSIRSRYETEIRSIYQETAKELKERITAQEELNRNTRKWIYYNKKKIDSLSHD